MEDDTFIDKILNAHQQSADPENSFVLFVNKIAVDLVDEFCYKIPTP
jgi:hypothetical protein